MELVLATDEHGSRHGGTDDEQSFPGQPGLTRWVSPIAKVDADSMDTDAWNSAVGATYL